MSFYDIKTSEMMGARSLFLSILKDCINDKNHYFRESITTIIKEASMAYNHEITPSNFSNDYYSHKTLLYLRMLDKQLECPKRITSKYLTKVYDIFASEDAYICFKYYR